MKNTVYLQKKKRVVYKKRKIKNMIEYLQKVLTIYKNVYLPKKKGPQCSSYLQFLVLL